MSIIFETGIGKDSTGLFTSEDVYCCMTIKTLLMTNCPFHIGDLITCEPTCKSLPVMTEPATHMIVKHYILANTILLNTVCE